MESMNIDSISISFRSVERGIEEEPMRPVPAFKTYRRCARSVLTESLTRFRAIFTDRKYRNCTWVLSSEFRTNTRDRRHCCKYNFTKERSRQCTAFERFSTPSVPNSSGERGAETQNGRVNVLNEILSPNLQSATYRFQHCGRSSRLRTYIILCTADVLLHAQCNISRKRNKTRREPTPARSDRSRRFFWTDSRKKTTRPSSERIRRAASRTRLIKPRETVLSLRIRRGAFIFILKFRIPSRTENASVDFQYFTRKFYKIRYSILNNTQSHENL